MCKTVVDVIDSKRLDRYTPLLMMTGVGLVPEIPRKTGRGAIITSEQAEG